MGFLYCGCLISLPHVGVHKVDTCFVKLPNAVFSKQGLGMWGSCGDCRGPTEHDITLSLTDTLMQFQVDDDRSFGRNDRTPT